MLIKVDEFPSGLVKTKPNNGELEKKRRKTNQESEGHPWLGEREREREKSNTYLALRQRLHRIQLMPPPNSIRENAPREREKTARRSRVWPNPALQHIVYKSCAVDLQAATARTRSCGRILREKLKEEKRPRDYRVNSCGVPSFISQWHVSELRVTFEKRVNANSTICVLTIELFFRLDLFSLSNAEPLFRLPLHRNMEPVSTNPDAHYVYKRDSGTGFTVSGSCTTSRSSGGYDVHNTGSGDCHLSYGDCSASNSSGGGVYVEKIHDVYNAGSGNIFITYCGASTSGEELVSKCSLVSETRYT
ncbi:hypothetical protein AVEN_102150-1 [Araneus ventricosus]|uniref:Uncharacterized protein n=1 Tax=Araneus ventricosus TaxID=182803 RepID=A0A4Y2LMA3_ARAVE|nr:hypothetical protein AVEN_102150-1 [Araneus ventricosus]